MLFRYYDFIFIGILAVAGLIAAILFSADEDNGFNISRFCSILLGTLVIIFISQAITFWYRSSTASGIRSQKDYVSEMQNGIERSLTITAEDGREIFHYEGKIDIETDAEKNYICFESPEGKRYIIYYGIQDTITIIEK